MQQRSLIHTVILVGTLLCACATDEDLAADDVELASRQSALIVPNSDSTPPNTVSLTMGEPSGNYATVEAATSALVTLKSKTSVLDVRGWAIDSDSGILQECLWCATAVTSCNDVTGICSTSGPGLLGGPTACSPQSQAQPGQTKPESLLWLHALDLKSWIPQAGVGPGRSRTVDLICFLSANNNFGARAETGSLTLRWSEHYVAPPKTCADICYDACTPTCPSGREFKACAAECKVDCRQTCGPS